MSTRHSLGTSAFVVVFLMFGSVAMALEPPADGDANGSTADAERAANLEFFEKQVRPILVKRCHECHAAEEQEGGLRLDGIATILTGGDTGPAIVPGKPGESLLVEAIHYGPDSYQMPPPGKLPDKEIAALTRWVELGAPWPDETAAAGTEQEEFNLAERARHWSFQPIVAHAPPEVKDNHWPQSPIDHFILARLEAAGISPAAAADRRTLIRRVTFDLIGLPPTPAEVDAFLTDDSPDAWAKVVDRLLASPHYGERWARHWLDLVRYGESRGHEFDYDAPNAYQYRDYVIRALNADVPYDQFVVEHIAGDLLSQPRRHPTEDHNESILGTGFWFLGEWCHSPVDIRKDETDRFDNMIDVMSKTFLGLTVACARCHDHKFDAIRQRDYYALAGYLQSSTYRQVRFESIDHNRRVARELDELRKRHRGPILNAVGEALARDLAGLDDYLLAARDVIEIHDDASENTSAPDSSVEANRVTQIANGCGLDAERLQRLVEHLHVAATDADDPLHAWALLSVAKKSDSAAEKDVAHLLSPLRDEWKGRRQRACDMLNDLDVVFDFASAAAGDWIQDGFTFGPRPQRPGDVQWGDDAEKPIRRVFAAGAAVRDPAWGGLQTAAETEPGPGFQDKILLSGRTIRTRAFTVDKRYVCCLVEGAGQAYVVVNSHRMNQGPLHGRLIANSEADDDAGPHWIASDLRLCQGRDAHVEFTPAGDRPFAVRMVVQGEKKPVYVPAPGALLVAMLDGETSHSPSALARAYQRLLLETAQQLAADEIVHGDDAADRARLADWLIGHAELFATKDNASRSAITEIAAPFVEKQKELIAGIRRSSRTAMAMLDGFGEDEHLLVRGNHNKPAETVPRQFLETIAGADQPATASGSGRLELAGKLIEESNPLPARVMVNRLWQHHFGAGIVGSPDNFGILGQPPTHPELLDYLAREFIESNWSLKEMHRLMLLSSAYQMSSDTAASARQIDPANKLWHRMSVRRLEAEAVRDSVLAVSGRLDRTLFGPSVPTHLTPFMTGRGRPGKSGPLDGDGRRSIYIAVRRNFLTPMFLAFDFPTPFSTMGRRTESNVPAQGLTMMNNPLVAGEAQRWAGRLLAAENEPPGERIEAMYVTAFARMPTKPEADAALAFVTAQQANNGEDQLRAWSDLCHVLLNTKEFIFVR